MKNYFGAAILSGGKNNRMGGINKAFIEFGSGTILLNIIDVLSRGGAVRAGAQKIADYAGKLKNPLKS